MPHPTAPMLQAEYHNYNDQNAFNDYYGGYEPKTATRTSNGPRRIDITIDKQQDTCRGSGRTTVHCLNALVVARSIAVIALLFLLFQSGYRHDYVMYLAAFEAISLIASITMCCGIEYHQPFLCILFTVLRTMEAFGALVFCIAFGWALYDRECDAARYIRSATRDVARHYAPEMNIGWDDLSYQLTIALFSLSLLLLAICLFACRVSWIATMVATDERRRLKATQNHEVSRVMVASDELYTNY